MFLNGDIVNLALFCVQEFGVAIGIGAQMVMSVAYLQSMRDGRIDGGEAQFLRATRIVSFAALALIVVSGLLITALHVLNGGLLVVLSPAYEFKWALILIVLGLTLFSGSVPKRIFEALIAANWYALFLVHTLAPATGWINLLTWWAVWLIGFTLVWYALLMLTHERKEKTGAPETPEIKKTPEPVIKPTPKAAPEKSKIVLEPAKQPIQLPPPSLEMKPVITQIVPPQPSRPLEQPKTIPTEIPMPAGQTTDTPFLPKVPPLQPIPLQSSANPATIAPPQAATPLPGSAPAAPKDSLAINVMPKSPDQLPK